MLYCVQTKPERKAEFMSIIKEILKGVVIGIANIIPGVSGGTMAVSMGIYDKIIGAVTNILKDFKKSILTLIPYVIGMAVGILGLSMFIGILFEKFPMQTGSLFAGLILGGLPIIFSKIRGKKVDVGSLLLFVVFFAMIIAMQFLDGDKNASGEIVLSVIEVIKLFFVGVIASATMVIPGVSGSMILLSIGYYNPIIATIKGTVEALIGGDWSRLFYQIGILLPFGIGVVLGIYAIAKLIEFLLLKYECKTYYAILGLILASPFAIYMSLGINTLKVGTVIASIVMFAGGFFIAYGLSRKS